MLCAADEAIVEYSGGEVGVPLDETFECDFSFAEDDGIGNH